MGSSTGSTGQEKVENGIENQEGSQPLRHPKQIEHAIPECPGLSEVQYANNRSFVFNYKDPKTGKRRRHTLKSPRPSNVFEAGIQVQGLIERLGRFSRLDDVGLSFTQVVDQAILPAFEARSDSRKNQRYCRDLKNRFDSYWRKSLDGLAPEQVTPSTLQRAADSMKPVRLGKARLSNATYNKSLAAIKIICKAMEARGYLVNNPAKSLEVRREDNQRTRIIQDHEMQDFFVALNAMPQQFRLFIWFLLLTGLRLREALTSRWADVSIEQRTLLLRETKNGKPHVVPLSINALAILHELKELCTNEFLFPGKSEGGHMARPGRQFRNLLAKAGTQGLWLHDCRRTAASLACRNGASIHDVSKLLNHSHVSVTERYVMAHSPRIAAAVQGIDDQLQKFIITKNEV